MKRCTRCGKDKPRDAFSRNRGHSDGLQSYCRACNREAVRALRSSSPGVRARDTKQARAYQEADRLLRAAHREEWDRYYQQARKLRGIAS